MNAARSYRIAPLPWRSLGWGGAALLLAVPLVSRMPWTGSDFLIMGILFAVMGGLIELSVRLSRHWAYRAGFALAVLGGFLMVWINGAVGIVAEGDNVYSLWLLGVLALGAVGGLASRLRAKGLAVTMLAMAVAQMVIAALAFANGVGRDTLVILFFTPFWLGAAGLFALATGREVNTPS